MNGLEVLWVVYEWLPRVFVLDVLAFHLLADHPLAARCWTWRPPGERRRLRNHVVSSRVERSG
jgi:hypothetical protein